MKNENMKETNEINGTTHCLNCGNEFLEEWEFEFNLCTDCIFDATCEFMSKNARYPKWIVL